MGRRRRVRYLNLPLGRSRRLSVSLRKFRTAPQLRSKKFRQAVFQARIFGYKEFAFAIKKRKSPETFLWLPAAAVRNLVFAALAANIVALTVAQAENAQEMRLASLQMAAATAETISAPPLPKTMPRSEPARVKIPRIGVDAPLVKLGQASDGSMQIPARFDRAGWYKKSPTPGELGPAVIVGHVDSYEGTAIFWRLRELRPKDVIEVKRKDGLSAKFRVAAVEQVPQSRFPAKEVYGNIDYSGLRLVTCSGVFNHQSQRYSHNLVVYGKLI